MAKILDAAKGWNKERLLKLCFGLVILAVCCVFLFARLGFYALWDDEAVTGIMGKGILLTGDTSVVVGHNISAYGGGVAINDNLRDRTTPPLPLYLIAASFVATGQFDSFSGRLPFALCGLATVGLIIWWLKKDGASSRMWWLIMLGFVGNVSFFLYCRQCRYYGLSIFLSTAIVYLYLHWKTRKELLLAGCLMTALVATQYMSVAALVACLALDYLLWGRKQRPIRAIDWLCFLLPCILIGPILVWIWNPFALRIGGLFYVNDWMDRLTLFYRNLRDLTRAEFGPGLLFLLFPLIYFWRRDIWLIRGLVAILVYAAVIALVSIQLAKRSFLADVRYLAPIIPACIALACWFLNGVRLPNFVLIPASFLILCSNLFSSGLLFGKPLHFTFIKYLAELSSPPSDPYLITAAWINEHVQDGESIWAVPGHTTYPLMFHAPHALYAWQLEPAAPGKSHRFKNIPPIHFKGQALPDYAIAFGPTSELITGTFQHWPQPVKCERIARIDHFWQDQYRPELFLRSFGPVRHYDHESDAIYVFKITGVTGNRSAN